MKAVSVMWRIANYVVTAGEASAEELGEELGISPTVLTKLLAMMVAERLLVAVPATRSFGTGYRALEIAGIAWSRRDVRACVISELCKLRSTTRHTVRLAVSRQGKTKFVEQLEGWEPVRVSGSLGGKRATDRCLHASTATPAVARKGSLWPSARARSEELATDGPGETASCEYECAVRDVSARVCVDTDDECVAAVVVPVENPLGEIVAAVGVYSPAFPAASNGRVAAWSRFVSETSVCLRTTLPPYSFASTYR